MKHAAALLCLLIGTACADEPASVEVPRADGTTTALRVYQPRAAAGCAPLAVISHGAGGSENGYAYLAEFLADQGYRTLVLRHRESDRAALAAAIRAARDIRQGVTALVTDPAAEAARILDLGAALDFAEAQCHSTFKALLGHSMGANTVMLEAGAQDMLGLASPVRGQHRFDAYVALSPEGPGLVFPAHAWQALRRPVLTMSGTRDAALTGGPQTRQLAWQDMPGDHGCQWQAVVDGATHMNFGGAGPGAGEVEAAVTATVGSFLTGVRAGTCRAPASHGRITFASK